MNRTMRNIESKPGTAGTGRTLSGEAGQAAFLLGGIGTGNVSLGSRGDLRDWELWGKPGKGNVLPNTYFSIWAKSEGEKPAAMVLESRLLPPHVLHSGYQPDTAAGLPRFRHSTMRGEYPLARIDFEDERLPLKVSLEAFTPFIPLNEDESGIPGTYLTYKVENPTDKPVDVTIAGSILNPVGIEYNGDGSVDYAGTGQNVNDFVRQDGLSGLYMHSGKYASDELRYGNVSLVTTNKHVTYKRAWLRGAWFDYLQDFWDDFSTDGKLEDPELSEPSKDGVTPTGTLGACERLEPGEVKEFRFVLTWYFPNRMNGWTNRTWVYRDTNARNYYAGQFDSSLSAAAYLIRHRERLTRETTAFHDALFGSTLPRYVVECMANNITVLRSPTCFRLASGRFLAYEGCFDREGSCEGNCTHVWNYAQTVAFLFPKLEQDMRRMEFLEESEEDGKMNFRAYKLFGFKWLWYGDPNTPAAVDGQAGSIMRVYREWKMTGDTSFLSELWPAVKKSLDFIPAHWDTDGDSIPDGKQHNTYDIEFYGPNPLTGIMYLGALKAASEMASHMGEDQLAESYRTRFAAASDHLDRMLWNDEYYAQRLDDLDLHKYQFGTGCLSDQLLGQALAHLYGLGYLLPEQRVKQAIRSIYKYNYKESFESHVNCQRTFVLNDEKGLVICTWPHGGRPRFPFVYSHEVWTGIEYQVAAHLIREGFVEEGLTLVRTVWERHDGVRRNPWNEAETGGHYVRAMASWALLPALSGFEFDMVRGEMKFAPVVDEERFSSFWSTGKAWGVYTQSKDPVTGEWEADVKVLYGDASGIRVSACGRNWLL